MDLVPRVTELSAKELEERVQVGKITTAFRQQLSTEAVNRVVCGRLTGIAWWRNAQGDLLEIPQRWGGAICLVEWCMDYSYTC